MIAPDAPFESLPAERMSKAALDSLLEYSLSLPSVTTIGKKWKRRIPAFGPLVGWAIGEYVESGQPNRVGIEWRRVELEEREP